MEKYYALNGVALNSLIPLNMKTAIGYDNCRGAGEWNPNRIKVLDLYYSFSFQFFLQLA